MYIQTGREVTPFYKQPWVRMAGNPERPEPKKAGMLLMLEGLPDLRAMIPELGSILEQLGTHARMLQITKLVSSKRSYKLLNEAPVKVLPYVGLTVILQLDPKAYQAFSLEKFAQHVGVPTNTVKILGKNHFLEQPLPPSAELDGAPSLKQAEALQALGEELQTCVSPENGPILLFLNIEKQKPAP